jgi:hypothetical protein
LLPRRLPLNEHEQLYRISTIKQTKKKTLPSKQGLRRYKQAS